MATGRNGLHVAMVTEIGRSGEPPPGRPFLLAATR